MATNVAERAALPTAAPLPPTSAVRLRATAVTWSWRAFLTVVYLVLFGPLVILMLFSVNDSNVLAFPLEGVTFHWYTDAFHDQLLHAALVNSIVVACIVAPVCLVLGTLTAFGLTRFRFRGRSAVSALVAAPLILPWLIIGIAALMFYVRFHVDLSLKTVIATQIVCTFPLVTAIVGAQLFRFQRVQEEAAIDLGCSRMQVLRHIIMPHIAPALAASAIFAFTWSFNNYEISAFTLGFQQTFPVWVYSSVRNPDHTAVVNAISTVISIVQVVLLTIALLFLRARSGEDATRGIIAGGESVAASATT
jgi:ABC-type spermidine/putrescine transport system permease subunit II